MENKITSSKWIIFSALCLSTPLFFFLFVAAGFMPPAFLLITALHPKMAIFSIPHAIIYIPLLYLASKKLANFSCSRDEKFRKVFLIAFSLTSMAIACIPIYGIKHHSTEPSHNAYQTIIGTLIGAW